RGQAAVEGNGRAALVRDPGSARKGNGALRPPRRQRECRLLLRRYLSPARHSERSVRADLRRRPRARVDGPGIGAAGQQHSHPATNALERPWPARLCSYRPARMKAAREEKTGPKNSARFAFAITTSNGSGSTDATNTGCRSV